MWKRVKSCPKYQRGRKELGLLNVDANRLSRLKFPRLSNPHSGCSRWKKRRYPQFMFDPAIYHLLRSYRSSEVFKTTDLTSLLIVKNSKTLTIQTQTVGEGIIIIIDKIGPQKDPSGKAISIGPSEGIDFNHLWRMQLWMSPPSRLAMQRFTGTRTALSMSSSSRIEEHPSRVSSRDTDDIRIIGIRGLKGGYNTSQSLKCKSHQRALDLYSIEQ